METCACCMLPKFDKPVSRSDKRPPICPDCSHHVGSQDGKSAQRDKDHLKVWGQHAAKLSSEIAEQNVVLGRAESQIRRLDAMLHEATQPIVEGYFQADIGEGLRRVIETDVVREEEAKRNAAYRALGRMNGALLDIADLHERLQDKCKCGKVANRCHELAALIPIEDELMKWEKQQINRMERGERHDLRRDHPKARRYSSVHYYQWRGLPARPDRDMQPQHRGR